MPVGLRCMRNPSKGVLVMAVRFLGCGTGCLVLSALLAVVAGCKEQKPVETDAGPAVQVAQAVQDAAASPADVQAKLAAADVVDGTADKIVKRCASCALGMDGSSDHTLTAMDYTLYFCTERCAKVFAEDTTKSILAMEIPED